MKYGLFNNNILLGYSDIEIENYTYLKYNEDRTTESVAVNCLPDVPYGLKNIGKTYDPSTKQFS